MSAYTCICSVGDPCDYHAATCIVCPGGCKGHPSARLAGDEHMGQWVYCSQHLRPHSTGWCTVRPEDKTPLKATTREEAYEECKERELKVLW